jgi:predicted MFS family arabinose efflux permease
MRRILEAYRQSFSGLPGTAWRLAAVTLVNRSGTMVLPFLALYLTSRERGFTTSEAGWVQAVYGLGSLAGAWLGGLLTDRLGSRRVQVTSLIANGIGFLVLGWVTSRTGIFVVAGAVSIASEAFRPANAAALAAAATPQLTARVFALSRMAVNMGMSLGVAIGGVLAEHVGFFWLFVVDGITCLLAAALLVGTPSGAPEIAKRPGAARSPGPWSDRFFVTAWVFIVLLAMVFFQLHGAFTLYLRDAYHLSKDAIGGLMAINTVLVVALEVVVVHRLEKKEPLRLVAFGAFVVCLGFALLAHGRSPAWAAGTIVIWTAGEIISFAFLSSFVVSRSTKESQGRYMALYVMAFGLAFVIAPLAGTRVYEEFGGEWVFHGCGVIGVILLAAFGSLAWAKARGLDARSRPADVHGQ